MKNNFKEKSMHIFKCIITEVKFFPLNSINYWLLPRHTLTGILVNCLRLLAVKMRKAFQKWEYTSLRAILHSVLENTKVIVIPFYKVSKSAALILQFHKVCFRYLLAGLGVLSGKVFCAFVEFSRVERRTQFTISSSNFLIGF